MEKTKERYIAFKAVHAFLARETFLVETLEPWRLQAKPSQREKALAMQIASGTIQRLETLHFLMKEVFKGKKQHLSLAQKALLLTAIYQLHFLKSLPSYAVVNESVEIAKELFGIKYSRFFNFLLREYERIHPTLQEGSSLQEKSTYFSYPHYFIEATERQYGLPHAKEIWIAGNQPQATFLRMKGDGKLNKEPFFEGLTTIYRLLPEEVESWLEAKEGYIQNPTPILLLLSLQEQTPIPATILDLCSSPGGKLLLLDDLYPKAQLVACDLPGKRWQRLSQTIDRFALRTKLLEKEKLKEKGPFDLVVVDAPCSNSGVLHKRPEARWRLSSAAIETHAITQLSLIEEALALLKKGGHLWYLTCSILAEENERVVLEACRRYSLTLKATKTILPSEDGCEGGFAALLT